ncbi:MAG: Lrp/AsnC family transcriptional regulator [Desulfobacter sp.]|nr:MAG: Lrp/AsnC family transcriptional regulator [Desulfobacter sp.]WDP90345.1 MAG: Lrp/AsnC family transcriptional regulator [Desulfobacter sp.]
MDNLDGFDIKILSALQQDGRISNVKLAKQLSISEAPCWRRLKRLKESGIIEGYQAILNRRKLGFGVMSFIQLKFVQHDKELTQLFEDTINECPEVMACHNTSGAADFLLIVVARDLDAYVEFIDHKLRKIPGITDITSNISLRELKSSFKLPL